MTSPSPSLPAATPALGAEPPSLPAPSLGKRLAELLSSMRFAVALLAVICMASVIGTVLPQGQAPLTYVDQFGPFWAQVFELAGLDSVYGANWFVLMLAVLIVSTALCIYRTAPRLLREWRNYREDVRVRSLQAFGHRASGQLRVDAKSVAEQSAQMLAAQGWRVKLAQRALPGRQGRQAGWMVAAQKGGARKLGYVATHGAIVLICLGGLLDSDLALRGAMWLHGVSPYEGGGLVKDVPASHRMPVDGFSYRGQMAVAEGTQSSVALIGQGNGVVLQPLPFAIELKKFIVDYYPTGMPSRFASEIVLHDLRTGERRDETVEVNKPASIGGVQIYQSSFEDGGSALQLKIVPLADPAKASGVQAKVGASQSLMLPGKLGQPATRWTLEPTELRVMNVEPAMQAKEGPQEQGDAAPDVRAVNPDRIMGRTGLMGLMQGGAAASPDAEKKFQNVGPSIGYRLRDDAGQAYEFVNYMQPVDAGDGEPVYLHGVRLKPSDPVAYLRVPVDVLQPGGGQTDFWRLRSALDNDALRRLALDRYVEAAAEKGNVQMRQALRDSATRVLELFAGTPGVFAQSHSASSIAVNEVQHGLPALSRFLEQQVPAAQRPQATRLMVDVLRGVLYQLLVASREADGQTASAPDLSPQRLDTYMRQAVLALSDSALYPVPVVLELEGFEQVQASVFQVARAPGKPVVYLGCLLLVLGIFAMLYVRDRRLWLWAEPDADANVQHGATRVQLAYSCNRRTSDADREFSQWRERLLGVEQSSLSSKT